MPRCYTIKKINAQQQSIQQYCSNNNTRRGSRIGGVGDSGANGSRNGNAVGCAEDDENINNDRVNRIATIGGGARANKGRNDCGMAKNRVRGRNGSSSGSSSGINGTGMTSVASGNGIDDSFVCGRRELKATAVQSKKLVNGTRAAVQRQCKDDSTGPTSPTEATVAPIYYTNANAHEPKMGKATSLISFVYIFFFLFSLQFCFSLALKRKKSTCFHAGTHRFVRA